MKLHIDMNLPPARKEVPATEGFDAVHWSEVGDPRATDAVILEWARENELVVLTHDLDFGAVLAATKGNAPSVVQVRTQDVTPAGLRGHLCRALRQYLAWLEAGALVTVDETKSRARILPLERQSEGP